MLRFVGRCVRQVFIASKYHDIMFLLETQRKFKLSRKERMSFPKVHGTRNFVSPLQASLNFPGLLTRDLISYCSVVLMKISSKSEQLRDAAHGSCVQVHDSKKTVIRVSSCELYFVHSRFCFAMRWFSGNVLTM